jgi:hypothetical protein
MRVNCIRVAGRVTTPTLVTSYQREQLRPGQAAVLCRLLRSQKSFHAFTAAEGAGYHDEPMASQRRTQVVSDWLSQFPQVSSRRL